MASLLPPSVPQRCLPEGQGKLALRPLIGERSRPAGQRNRSSIVIFPALGQLICMFVHLHPLASLRVHTRPVQPAWGRSPTSTLVHWVWSQGIPKVACFALLTVDTSCVMDALQTPARQGVTVPGGPGVHIVVAQAELTRLHWATFPKGVPKVAVGTELTAGTWREQHHIQAVIYQQSD